MNVNRSNPWKPSSGWDSALAAAVIFGLASVFVFFASVSNGWRSAVIGALIVLSGSVAVIAAYALRAQYLERRRRALRDRLRADESTAADLSDIPPPSNVVDLFVHARNNPSTRR